jgi:hypothetical protein
MSGPPSESDLKVTIGPFRFGARLRPELAPQTCAYFRGLLPYRRQMLHVRWSGLGCWIPLGYETVKFPFENPTSYPAPGEFIFYPGGYGESEILLAYGAVRFAASVGQLAGNPFLRLTDGLEQLPELGRLVLWEGAQDACFELA